MIVVKPGVKVAGIDSRMQYALDVCEKLYDELNADLVITSGLRPESHGSKHRVGLAFDIRIRQFTHEEQTEIHRRLWCKLGSRYDVLIKRNPPHIHIEWEPK
jgi:hypothetical protein